MDNFGTVVPDNIYRSGQLLPHQIKQLAERYGIRTILQTNDPLKNDSSETVKKFEDTCRELNINIIQIPMSGDGVASYEKYNTALETIMNPENRPLLVCCARGSYRTGAIIAIYRVFGENTPVSKALKEMEKYDFNPYNSDGKPHRLLTHLLEYFKSKGRLPATSVN